MSSAGDGPSPPTPAGLRPFNRLLDWIWGYVEDRLGVSRWPLRPQPSFSFSPAYWTGAFVAAAFIFQAISGMLLLIYYDPSTAATTVGGPPAAWASTQYILQKVPFGGLLLSVHLYGAYATIFLAFLHFFRGFYTGAYKPPREAAWFVGAALLMGMLGMGFTGYLLPYTSLSVGATDVGITLATSAVPIGPVIAPFLQGDGTYQGLLSRMFAFHVAVIPVVLCVLLWLHVTIFETHGIAPPPSSDPRARRTVAHAEDRRIGNWFPSIFLYGLKWTFAYLGALLLIVAAWPVTLAPAFGSANQGGVSPEPDWYFLWLYKLADFSGVTPLIAMGILGFVAIAVLLLPWIDQLPGWIVTRVENPRTHPRDRPLMVFFATFLLGFFALMTVWGGVMPGTIIPASMYLAYLGTLAVVDGLVVLVYFARYRARYARRLARAPAAPAPPVARVVPVPLPPSGGAFWNVWTASFMLVLAGLLVPLGYVLTLHDFTSKGAQQGLALALAVISFALAFLVELAERAFKVHRPAHPIPAA